MEQNSAIPAVNDRSNHFVVFTLDEQRFALPLSAVGRVIRGVEITTLSETPETVLGVINVQGQIIPVINIRKRLRLSESELNLSDQIIIAHAPGQTIAFVVDAVTGVVECSEQQSIMAEKILPGLRGYTQSMIKADDNMIIVCDLVRFLSLTEAKTLGDAMEDMGNEI